MERLHLFLACAFCVAVTLYGSETSSRCSVSRQNTSMYFYPFDIFEPQLVLDKEKNKYVQCSAMDGMLCPPMNDNSNCHMCPLDRNFCPVANENIDSALHRSTQLSRSTLCLIKQKLMNAKETVRLVVSGGSVTMGACTTGCCADTVCNPGSCNDVVPCRWSSRLIEWLAASYPARIEMKFLAGHGFTSSMAIVMLNGKMEENHMDSFTSNDLILLDHSVNDSPFPFGVDNGLESLIRRIYHRSTPRSFPSIVILDSDPNPSRSRGKHPYYEAYERVARHYDIPVWSYRDSVLSEFARNQSFANYTNFVLNSGHDSHPGWPVHLFMADLYASLFVHETEKWCDVNQSELKGQMDVALKMHKRTFAELPKPMIANMSQICTVEYLSLSHHSIKQNLHPVGSYRFEPESGGWSLGVDKEGRLGGFLVNASAPVKARLVFTLNATVQEMVNPLASFRVMVHYLRTYENAGLVSVTMCGNPPTVLEEMYHLDALWTDHSTHRVSLPDKWEMDIPYALCMNSKQERPTIEFTFNHEYREVRGDQKFKLMSIKDSSASNPCSLRREPQFRTFQATSSNGP